MQKYSIIFINTTHEQGSFIPADATLGISTLQYWLAHDSIMDTALFPEEPDADITNIHTKFEAFLSGNSAKIFAISCWSNSFTTAELFAAMIRKTYPEALIIGGGAHFYSKDNISKNLHNKLFDIIFKGGADPFFEFCTNFLLKNTLSVEKTESGVKMAGQIPTEGIHYLEGGRLAPRKHGVLSRAVVPVMHITEEFAEITVLFSDKCDNNCDYCTVFKNKSTEETRLVTESFVKDCYTQLKSIWEGSFKISVMDSSPFMDSNRKFTLGTIKRLSALGGDISYSVFADPYDLDEEFSEIIKTYPLVTFFIGRDRIDRDEFIGRRLKGRLRDQKQLNNERVLLSEFIQEMDAGENPLQKEVYLGYIVSPYDKEKDAERLLAELEEFIGLAKNITVQPNIFILNPYSGTSVQRKAQGDIWDIAEFAYPYPNVWKGEDTSMLWLELIRLVVSPVFSTGLGANEGLILLKYTKYFVFNKTEKIEIYGEDTVSKTIKAFMQDVEKIGFGRESTLAEWQNNLIKIYWWGLLLVTTVKSPEYTEKHGLHRIMNYIKENDIMIHAFTADLKLIKNKDHSGTWYQKFTQD